jgi:hypothetical protein
MILPRIYVAEIAAVRAKDRAEYQRDRNALGPIEGPRSLIVRHIMMRMLRRILLTALAGVTLLFAADPTGTWTGDQPGRDGNTYHITFKLKADGGKLTGTMGGDQFEQPIQNAEIHGDDISFTVHLEFGDGIDLKYTGKVATDRIDFKVQRSGSDAAQPFVAKKTQ